MLSICKFHVKVFVSVTPKYLYLVSFCNGDERSLYVKERGVFFLRQTKKDGLICIGLHIPHFTPFRNVSKSGIKNVLIMG